MNYKKFNSVASWKILGVVLSLTVIFFVFFLGSIAGFLGLIASGLPVCIGIYASIPAFVVFAIVVLVVMAITSGHFLHVHFLNKIIEDLETYNVRKYYVIKKKRLPVRICA